MKVYQSLAKAKTEFHKLELKKSGHNKFANYYYFELSDFIIPIVDLLDKNNLVSFVSFNADLAILKVIHIEDQSEIVITSPMSSANLKGCHDVQNLGAVQTYLRRYLYTSLFDIIEHDVLDMTHGKNVKPEPEQLKTEADLIKERLQSLDLFNHYMAFREYLNKAKIKSVSDKQRFADAIRITYYMT